MSLAITILSQLVLHTPLHSVFDVLDCFSVYARLNANTCGSQPCMFKCFEDQTPFLVWFQACPYWNCFHIHMMHTSCVFLQQLQKASVIKLKERSLLMIIRPGLLYEEERCLQIFCSSFSQTSFVTWVYYWLMLQWMLPGRHFSFRSLFICPMFSNLS